MSGSRYQQPRTAALAEARQRAAAQKIENKLDHLRSHAVIHARWWRPFWQSGYDAGLRAAHEEVQQILDAHGIWHPAGEQRG